MDTHAIRVKKHLVNHGSITSMEAFAKYGNTRLSATIHELRHKHGMNIISVREQGKSRFDTKTNYVRYVYVRD